MLTHTQPLYVPPVCCSASLTVPSQRCDLRKRLVFVTVMAAVSNSATPNTQRSQLSLDPFATLGSRPNGSSEGRAQRSNQNFAQNHLIMTKQENSSDTGFWGPLGEQHCFRSMATWSSGKIPLWITPTGARCWRTSSTTGKSGMGHSLNPN